MASLLKEEYSLSKFLVVVGIKDCVNQGIKVEIEKGIENNRRIDIWIETNELIVVIENKIYAKDQPAQVWDYYKYADEKKQDKPFYLLYLTLDGKEPSFESRKTLLPHNDNNFHCISYRKHIQKWLEEIENIENQLFIQNYLYLIRRLGGRKEHTLIQEKIMDELIQYTDEDFEAIEKIYQAQKNAKSDLLRNFWYQLEKKLIEAKIITEKSKNYFNSENYRNLEEGIKRSFQDVEKQYRKPFGFDIKIGECEAESVFFRIQTHLRENGSEIQYGIWVSENDNLFIDKAKNFPSHGTKSLEKYAFINAKYKVFFAENVKEYHYQWNLVVKTELYFAKLSQKNIELFSDKKMEKWEGFENIVQIIRNCMAITL